MQNDEDFFTSYFEFIKDTEAPKFFHRWSVIASIGALLTRQFYLRHGNNTIYPNLYCMLIGNPGVRKSTAIKTIKKIIRKSGYTTIAADKTSKEKFLIDLGNMKGEQEEDILEQNIWSGQQENTAEFSELFIMADEFNDFMGNGNIEFASLLGNLWDYSGVYESRLKNSKSVFIPNPTISILAGNTPTGFSLAFPPEIMGQGFFSRLLLIYGEPTGRKIAFPRVPEEIEIEALADKLCRIKDTAIGEVTLSKITEKLLSKIYHEWSGVRDVRFEAYSNRRFDQLIKLCLIHAAARYSAAVDEQDVIYSNTVLTHTEHLMPKALGEFGKAKNSDVSNKLMQLLDSTTAPLSIKDLWKNVHTDLEKMNDLTELLRNLVIADKIQTVDGGFLPKKRLIQDMSSNSCIDYSLLTEEERGASK